MTARGRQMRADRALRNSALALVKADIANLRGDLAKRSPAERAMDKAKDAAIDVLDEAAYVTDQHRGLASAVVAAIILWFARRPILGLLFGRDEDEDEEDDGYDRDRAEYDFADEPPPRRYR